MLVQASSTNILGAMDIEELARSAERFASPYRVTSGKGFRLAKVDPDGLRRLGGRSKAEAKVAVREGVEALSVMQEMLYAQNRWAVLAMFQAMDGAGKDGAIKHVMSGINPQGCHVSAFKAPSSDELDHDFLWRCMRQMPARGRIGIFNRSYYEEVLIVRVHQKILDGQRLPKELVTKRIWKERFEDIRAYERYLARNGVAVVKFFLHLSRDEQKRRFLARLDDPERHWKFSANDIAERQHWDAYMEAYEEAIRATATPEAPWYVIPADHKWFARMIVAGAMVQRLHALDLKFPQVEAAAKTRMNEARELLMRKGG